jgi:PAS domain-containing protein
MQRFVLRQNISRFQGLLEGEADPDRRATLRSLLASATRDLALIEAQEAGARPCPVEIARGPADRSSARLREFTRLFEEAPDSFLLLDPGPGLHIVDLNASYEAATLVKKVAVVGERLFDVFPDNPADPLADGVNNLYRSLCSVAETGRPHAMAIQRYDIRDADGRFQTRYWQPVNAPIFSDGGKLLYILHSIEDVTAQAAAAGASPT